MKESYGFRNRKFCLEGPKDLGKPGDVTLRKCNSAVEHQVYLSQIFKKGFKKGTIDKKCFPLI